MLNYILLFLKGRLIVIQKLNNEQLQRLYFESSIPTKSFHERKDNTKMDQSKQSFFDTSTNYGRFGDEEINRYENFFNTYVYPSAFKEPEVDDSDIKSDEFMPAAPVINEVEEDTASKQENSQLSQLEKDLLEQIKIDKALKNKTAPVAPTSNINGASDDDLDYLDALVNNKANDITSPDSNSLGSIFDEIVDNEKESISNYESSVFDANVQMLFDDVPEVDFPPPPIPEMPIDNNLENSELAPEMAEIPDFNFEMPPIPAMSVDNNLESPLEQTPMAEIPEFNFEVPPIPEPPADEIPTPNFEMPIVTEPLVDEIPTPSFEMPIVPEPPVDEIPTPSFEMPIVPEPLVDEIPTPAFEMPIVPEMQAVDNQQGLNASINIPPPNFEMPIIPAMPINGIPEDLDTSSADQVEPPGFEIPIVPAMPIDDDKPEDLLNSPTNDISPPNIEIPIVPPSMEADNNPQDLFNSNSDIGIPILMGDSGVAEQEFVEAAIEEFVPEQKNKGSKLSFLDTILVAIILVIVSVLVWNYRDLLPFDLPF